MSGLPAPLHGLLDGGNYPHPVESVRLIETPISWVLLTGLFAYKLKRPVRLPFVDMRSFDHRRFLCHEELRLNRRFAPEVYLEVCPVTQAGERVRMCGDGRVVEHAVRMRQFDPAEGLEALIERHDVDALALARFGARMAASHASLPTAQEPGAPGDPEITRELALQNLAQCRQALRRAGVDDDLEDVRGSLTALQEALQPVLQQRWRRGCVKECHGDLHAGNVVRRDGSLMAFDCLEFEPKFRWMDVGLEIAFLYADLQARHAASEALAFLSGYLEASGDYEPLRLLPLNGADRALVRAKVAALEAVGAADDAARRTALGRAGDYLRVARLHAQARAHRGRLILMCGRSGSGKSHLAANLAARLAALHLRSDVLRRHVTIHPEGAYSSATTLRTYERLAESAADALAGGLDVIVDATFLRRANRADFKRLAAVHGARLCLVHCDAPEDVLRARIVRRARQGNDPSEATPAVLEWQRGRFEPVQAEEGIRVIEADTTRPDVLDDVCGAVGADASPRADA